MGSSRRASSSAHMSKDKVKEVQAALKSKGMDPGPEDGVLGRKTQQAIREFQKSNNLQATGRIDDKTASALGVDVSSSDMGSSSSSGMGTSSSPSSSVGSSSSSDRGSSSGMGSSSSGATGSSYSGASKGSSAKSPSGSSSTGTEPPGSGPGASGTSKPGSKE
jgi:hypothetical protein